MGVLFSRRHRVCSLRAASVHKTTSLLFCAPEFHRLPPSLVSAMFVHPCTSRAGTTYRLPMCIKNLIFIFFKNYLLPAVGVEPTRCKHHLILRLARHFRLFSSIGVYLGSIKSYRKIICIHFRLYSFVFFSKISDFISD